MGCLRQLSRALQCPIYAGNQPDLLHNAHWRELYEVSTPEHSVRVTR